MEEQWKYQFYEIPEHLSRYFYEINYLKGVREATRETVIIDGIGGKRVKIPLCKITLKSQWKNGPIQFGVVDKLPMKGISLILGN